MWLVLVFQFWYVADGLYNEPALFTTMDIITDGFGWMLAVGDLTWVPFTYTLQARYLAFHPVELGPMRTAAIVGVNLLGYWIFRTANNEKNEFRSGKNPKSMFIPSLSQRPAQTLFRSQVHGDKAWHQAPDFWLVEYLTASQLPVCPLTCLCIPMLMWCSQWWPRYGPRLVPSDPVWRTHHLLLCLLFSRSPYPSSTSRRWSLRKKVGCRFHRVIDIDGITSDMVMIGSDTRN